MSMTKSCDCQLPCHVSAENVDESPDVNDHAEAAVDTRVQDESAISDKGSLRGNTAIVVVTSVGPWALSLVMIRRLDVVEVSDDGIVSIHVTSAVAA